MGYIRFDKTQLINLEYSLNKEVLRSNRAGSFACTTIVNCNTRKYHGLLICPLEHLDDENHVLLSGLDETIIQHGKEFHLAIRKYPGIFHAGHKYILDFDAEPIQTVTYKVGGVILKRENLLAEESERILIRYTLVDAHSPTTIRLHPFLAFRQVHKLSKANLDVNTKYEEVDHGIKTKMYFGYPDLFMQLSKKGEYISAPDWFYNVEYTKEQERGYESHEDLFVPGYFEFDIKKGESIVFAAGLKEMAANSMKRTFDTEVKKRVPRNSYENCLINAAQQFIIKKGDTTEIIAGYPWFGKWSRDTFISLPGLTLALDDTKTAKAVIDTMSADLKGVLFYNKGSHQHSDNHSADAPLWYIWAIHKYAHFTGQHSRVWKDWGKKMLRIIKGYRDGTDYNIKMHDNGLIYQGQAGIPLTWMDAVAEGKPVTPRIGYAVEINALWYNAICFMLELAKQAGDNTFINEWQHLPELIKKSFNDTFWDDNHKYLADYVDGDFKDFSVRPNMIIAAAMTYTPLSDEMKKGIIDRVQSELLTPRGLRSLAPKNPAYVAVCQGNSASRAMAYHQGSAWPWLLQFFTEAYLSLYEKSGLHFIKKLYEDFEPEMHEHGIGTISELYDGNPPHQARGAISKAWSVAALLCMRKHINMIENGQLVCEPTKEK